MINLFKKIIHKENASVVLENIIIMPIVFTMVFALIFMGFVEYQKSVMDAAVYRGALKASKMIANPHYFDSIEGENPNDPDVSGYNLKKNIETYKDNKPYRYLATDTQLKNSVISVEEDIKKYIGDMKLFDDNPSDRVQIDIQPDNKFLYQTVTVTASQSFEVPIAFGVFNPVAMELHSRAEVLVTDGAEFIRNTDLALELAIKASEQLKVPEMLDRVKQFFNVFEKK